jgi:ABC transport system ATP-binding/permease protein
MLSEYPGTILLVSHDRDFVDRIATSVLIYEEDGRWTEYAGGYTDMLAQRGGGVESRKLSREERVAGVARQSSSGVSEPRRKMTFKDKHALETLPKRIAELDAEMKKLESQLADPALFQRDPKKFHIATERFGKAAVEKSAAEDQWLVLEMQREEMAEG